MYFTAIDSSFTMKIFIFALINTCVSRSSVVLFYFLMVA